MDSWCRQCHPLHEHSSQRCGPKYRARVGLTCQHGFLIHAERQRFPEAKISAICVIHIIVNNSTKHYTQQYYLLVRGNY